MAGWEVLGKARPAITDEVGSGKAISAHPGITIIPHDAIGLKVGADEELADGVGIIFVEMTDLVTKPAVGAKEAKTVVRSHGHVSCDAHEQQGVAVRAPKSIDADGVATPIDAIGVAGEGCIVVWRARGVLGALANAGWTAPIGMGSAGALELINASEPECVAALDAFGKTRLVCRAARARLVSSTLFTPSVVRVGRGDLGGGSTRRRRGEAWDARVLGAIFRGNPLQVLRCDFGEIFLGDLIGKDDAPWSCYSRQWGAVHTAIRVWLGHTNRRADPPLSVLTFIEPPRTSVVDVLLPARARWLGKCRWRMGDAACCHRGRCLAS